MGSIAKTRGQPAPPHLEDVIVQPAVQVYGAHGVRGDGELHHPVEDLAEQPLAARVGLPRPPRSVCA